MDNLVAAVVGGHSQWGDTTQVGIQGAGAGVEKDLDQLQVAQTGGDDQGRGAAVRADAGQEGALVQKTENLGDVLLQERREEVATELQ